MFQPLRKYVGNKRYLSAEVVHAMFRKAGGADFFADFVEKTGASKSSAYEWIKRIRARQPVSRAAQKAMAAYLGINFRLFGDRYILGSPPRRKKRMTYAERAAARAELKRQKEAEHGERADETPVSTT